MERSEEIKRITGQVREPDDYDLLGLGYLNSPGPEAYDEEVLEQWEADSSAAGPTRHSGTTDLKEDCAPSSAARSARERAARSRRRAGRPVPDWAGGGARTGGARRHPDTRGRKVFLRPGKGERRPRETFIACPLQVRETERRTSHKPDPRGFAFTRST
ncbi:hypothetical protein SGRIM128S_07916 [Streptomyces griseomycini]